MQGLLPNGVPRQRRYAPRSKAGCVTCRRRRKRCPLGEPACDACQRLNLECVWSDKRRTHQAVHPSRRTQVEEVASFNGCHNTTPPPLLSPTYLAEWPSERPWQLGRSDERALLSYYIHCFVPKISVANTATSFFTSVYIPMAFQCQSVLWAILAAASAHLSRTSPDSITRTRSATISSKLQLLCHGFLRERLGPDGQLRQDTLEATAILLILIGLEVQKGSRNSKWMNQLDCVRKIIHRSGGPAEFQRQSWETSAMYEHYLYHDVMSIIMAGVAQNSDESTGTESDHSLDELSPTSTGFDIPSQPQPDSTLSIHPYTLDPIHPLLGLCRGLFPLIQQIRHVKPLRQVADSYPEKRRMIVDLEREILSVKFDAQHSSQESYLSVNMALHLDLVTLAETYRLAALILLYRWSRTCLDQVPYLGCQIVALAGRITEGSTVEAGLTYPLFLAGAELTNEDDILQCGKRLASIKQRFMIMNIEVVEQVLQEVWRDRLNMGQHRDWEVVLRQRQWVVSLA
ncbi:hypothetical protein NM208_g2169 [Fusarium decemcellulare]|uniref:Uncharacterized protein n=1 Tax=Fusarium decemcellulare TaxID=57161 RepID=A0ACC1STM8_9HYPO|nr:hypothetical protein NM208_g2169 [Fusarium decemcellulare]